MLSKGREEKLLQSQLFGGSWHPFAKLAGGLVLRKQGDFCREPDVAHELSLPGENKLPKYTAPESAAKPAKKAATTQKLRDAGEDIQHGGHSLMHQQPGTWHSLSDASFA